MADDPARLAVTGIEPGHVSLCGEIDAHSASDLTDAFEPWPADVSSIRLRMAEVTFMDSSGLRALIELRRRADDHGATLRIDAPSRAVARIIEISGLDGTIDIRPT